MNKENESYLSMLAARHNGFLSRDKNGNDISYLRYLKMRRRECKVKGIPFIAEDEYRWFVMNW